jgi:predicted oxidoreductase
MDTTSIPHTDFKPSRIVFGCMNLGRRWDARPLTDDQRREAFLAIDAGIESGMNMFDHADIYCHGLSESVFGEYLRAHPSLRDGLIIQSKCGIRFGGSPSPGDPGRYDFSYAHLTGGVEGILRRLAIDHLDILLLHRPDPLVQPEEVARAFHDLQKSGKVRFFGVSNHTGPQIDLLKRYVEQPLVANQVELSLVHHYLISEGYMFNRSEASSRLTGGTLDYCRRHDIRIQAWSPVAAGRATGNRDGMNEQQRNLAGVLAAMGSSHGVSPEAIMLAWLLRHPAGIQPVIGSTQPSRIAAAREADGVELTREEWYILMNAAQGHNMP